MNANAITAVFPSVPPAAHYSPGIAYGGLIFVSGQLPFKPGATERTVGTIEEQTRQAMANVEEILVAAGSSLDRLLSVTIYISDGDLWAGVNAAYASIMGDSKPARAIVPVKELHYGAQIEIQAIAAVASP
jgi:2-iminobutanoate/2-iminopropanoate deaminase